MDWSLPETPLRFEFTLRRGPGGLEVIPPGSNRWGLFVLGGWGVLFATASVATMLGPVALVLPALGLIVFFRLRPERVVLTDDGTVRYERARGGPVEWRPRTGDCCEAIANTVSFSQPGIQLSFFWGSRWESRDWLARAVAALSQRPDGAGPIALPGQVEPKVEERGLAREFVRSSFGLAGAVAAMIAVGFLGAGQGMPQTMGFSWVLLLSLAGFFACAAATALNLVRFANSGQSGTSDSRSMVAVAAWFGRALWVFALMLGLGVANYRCDSQATEQSVPVVALFTLDYRSAAGDEGSVHLVELGVPSQLGRWCVARDFQREFPLRVGQQVAFRLGPGALGQAWVFPPFGAADFSPNLEEVGAGHETLGHDLAAGRVAGARGEFAAESECLAVLKKWKVPIQDESPRAETRRPTRPGSRNW